jgi:hypothetical protein
MIVGMRPPASGSATPASDPDPVDQPSVSEPDGTRRALRVARRRRRQLALLCALAIGVCLLLTVLIVGLARDRTPSSMARPPLVMAAGGPIVLSVVSVVLPAPITPDAAGSQGGIP